MVNNSDPNNRYAPQVDENGEEIPDEASDGGEEEQIDATLHTRPSFITAVPRETVTQAGRATGSVLYKLGTELDSTVPKKRAPDDMADLFRGIRRDDPEVNFDDMVNVSNEDVYGPGDPDMTDLIEVSHEDIMGGSIDDLLEPYAPPRDPRRIVRPTVTRRTPPPAPSGMSGTGY